MPALQTTYNLTHAAGLEGLQANMEPVTIITRVADVVIGFGKVVVQGVADKSVRLPSSTAAPFRGITLLSHEALPVIGQAVDTFPAGAAMPVMTKGVIWVVASANVTVGTPAYFDASGNISGANTGTAIPNAIFDGTAAAGALVKLRLQ